MTSQNAALPTNRRIKALQAEAKIERCIELRSKSEAPCRGIGRADWSILCRKNLVVPDAVWVDGSLGMKRPVSRLTIASRRACPRIRGARRTPQRRAC